MLDTDMHIEADSFHGCMALVVLTMFAMPLVSFVA